MKHSFDCYLLLIFITLQRVPLLFNDIYILYFLSFIVLTPFWIYFFAKWFNILKKRHLSVNFNFRLTVLYLFLLLLIFFSLFRGYFYESFPISFLIRHLAWWTTVVVFGLTLFVANKEPNKNNKLREFIFYGLIFYVLTNVLLQLVGIVSPKEIVIWDTLGRTKMLSLFGIDAQRVAFAMSSGPVPFGIISGAVILMGIPLLHKMKKIKKIIPVLIILIGTYALLMTDSRSSMFWLFATILAYFLFSKSIYKILRVLPFVALFFPWLLIGTATMFANTDYSINLARSAGIDNITTLSKRTLVWSSVTEELLDFKPVHTIGYGARGQVASGIGRSYADVFEHNYAFNTDEKTVHNFALQQLLDVGYIGLLIYLLVFYQIIKHIEKGRRSIDGKLSLLFVIYICLSGASNVVPTIYNNELFTCFLLLISSYLINDKKPISNLK